MIDNDYSVTIICEKRGREREYSGAPRSLSN